jgi:hypothetical protein
MAVFRYDATIDPGQSHFWTVGGNGWFTDDHFPQFDARPVASPGIFPHEGDSPALVYKDFACALQAVWPYLAVYHLTVQNNSDRAIWYKMRVWVP